MSNKIHVTIVQDNTIINKAYINLVKHYYDVRLHDVNSLTREDINKSALIIVQVNLNDPNSIRPLKDFMALPERRHIPTLFLLREFSRREVIQANTLGATDYTIYPCPDSAFIQIMDDLVHKTVEKAWEKLSPAQEEALKVSLKVVEKTFHNASKGLEVCQADVKDSCSLIIEATAKDGLTDWMNAIKEHHDHTYRHSMMTCGYLVSFGMLLGVRKTDLKMLAVGGMMHDIGKARVPLTILDKPEELTPEEYEIIRKHPRDGRLILEKENWEKEIIDIAAHHHERLDGSGYPDGLKNTEISDIVRIVAIANIFSDLTDKRSRNIAMTAGGAIEKMSAMNGYLDITLVNAFRDVVLPVEDTNSAS